MLLFNPPQWLKTKQAEAISLGQVAGWPNQKDESWRYTSLKDLQKLQFSLPEAGGIPFVVPQDIMELVSGANSVLYFYNGAYVKALSVTQAQDDCVVSPLSRVLMSAGRLQEKAKIFLERKPQANLKKIGFDNLAHFNQGAYVQVETKNEVKIKIAVVHLYGRGTGSAAESPFVVYPRNIYIFGKNVEADFVEMHVALDNVQFKISSASDFILAEGAKVNASKISYLNQKAYAFHDVYSKIYQDAAFQYFDLSVGGHLLRNEFSGHLTEEGAEINLLNLNLAKAGSHIDNSTYIVHEKSYTKSHQLVRSLLGDSARSVFSGRLRIQQDAQKSNASQYCHNLLLSDTAEADARPQLEVFADDVKAAHGTTIGQLNAEQIFYLQSRAISKEKAEQMLAAGFRKSITQKIYSEYIKNIIETVLSEGPLEERLQ